MRPSPDTVAKVKNWWRKEGLPFLVLATVLFSVRSSLADWNDVPTGSMKPTIVEGDRVFVDKLAYDLKVPFTTTHLAEWGSPGRGQVVVFYSPHDGTRLVKRVVGLPGDTIELRNNKLRVNGLDLSYDPVSQNAMSAIPAAERQQRVYAMEQLPGETAAHVVAATPMKAARRNFGPFTVPEGSFFMMGDNRDDSFDSRYFGPVARKQIVGRARGVVLSFDKEHYWKPRFDRFFSGL